MRIDIDGDGIVYKVGFALQSKAHKQINADLICPYVTAIMSSILQAYAGYEYRVYLGTDTKLFRHDVATLQPYKGTRKKNSRPVLYQEVRDYLEYKFGALYVDGEEVDDRLGINMYTGRANAITTKDKDLRQIPGEIYDWDLKKKYYITPLEGYRFFCEQLVTGDITDNVPGLVKQLKLMGHHTESKLLHYSRENGKGYQQSLKESLLKQESEKDMYKVVVDLYKKYELYSEERLLELGRLLWIRRAEGEIWQPPI